MLSWAHIGPAGRLIWCPVVCLVGGCGTQAALSIERLPTLYYYCKGKSAHCSARCLPAIDFYFHNHRFYLPKYPGPIIVYCMRKNLQKYHLTFSLKLVEILHNSLAVGRCHMHRYYVQNSLLGEESPNLWCSLPSFVLIYAVNRLLSTIMEFIKIIFAYYIKLHRSKPRDPPILLQIHICNVMCSVMMKSTGMDIA